MRCVLLLVSCLASLAPALSGEVSPLADSPRQPRLFFVSTSSTTSTISTATVCFSSSDTPVTACRRKRSLTMQNKRRRTITEEAGEQDHFRDLIEPERTVQVEQGEEEVSHRQGRFFLYWITTTSTSTTTTFTTTNTILSVVCTPAGFFSQCG